MVDLTSYKQTRSHIGKKIVRGGVPRVMTDLFAVGLPVVMSR
jgi:hypothetical protein